jgi:hypothetical protein
MQPAIKRNLVMGGALLVVAGVAQVVVGLVWPEATAWLYRLAGPGTPTDFGPAAMLGVAIYGGLMVGWGVTCMALGKEHRVDVAVGAGLMAWFVTDSAGSVASGYPLNVLINAGFLVVFAPVLGAWWRVRRGSVRE